MTDQANEAQERSVSKRGEAAWKEARERIAQRNAQARKAGKQRREVHERHIMENRQEADRHRRGGRPELPGDITQPDGF